MTFLGDCYDEKGDTKGSNFSFAVYFTETNVLYYVDPLGWPVPERFFHIMHLIDNIRRDTCTTPTTISHLYSNIRDSVTNRERLPHSGIERVDNTTVLKAKFVCVACGKRMHKISLIRHQKMVHGGADVI